MASVDRKAFLGLPTGSSSLEYPSSDDYHSLNLGPSTDIFCAKTPKAFLFAAKVPQKMTHEKMLGNAEDDPAELLKVMDTFGETVRSICVDEPLVATSRKVTSREMACCPQVTLPGKNTSKRARREWLAELPPLSGREFWNCRSGEAVFS
jgi:hypothetical protein